MLSAPMGNFQGPFSNINNCLEHGFPFIYWRIAKLGSHFTAYSCVLRSSQKWCWCYIHATGLQWLAAEFLAWKDWFSKGAQLIVKMSEERKTTAQAAWLLVFFSEHFLRPQSDWIFQDEELDFISYSKGTKANILTHKNQPYKARCINQLPIC